MMEAVITNRLAECVEDLEAAGGQPIAVVACVLDAEAGSYVTGFSNENYPAAMEFQKQFKDLLVSIYGESE